MKTITVRVPARADLAGGTLDLWPLYLFHPGSRTVNVAVSLHAECEVQAIAHGRIEVELGDTGYRADYDSSVEMLHDENVSLIARAVEHFKLSGIHITTRTEVPRGSGLGGSSALAIAVVRALSEFTDLPVEGEALIALVRDLETRLLHVPAGVQDYYPPVYGGLSSLHLNPGAIVRQSIRLPLGELAQHFVLHYSEVSHFSGTNNWEIYKRHIDGDSDVRTALSEIAGISSEMEHALESHDLASAGRLLGEEWRVRKSLIEGISTSEIDRAITAGNKAGAWAGKVCGAGGGGCIVFLTPPERRDKVVRALRKVPGRTLDAMPVPYGLTVEQKPDKQSFAFIDRPSRAPLEAVDQLYLSAGGDGPYRPFVMIEGAVTFDDARRGTHLTISRALMAPVSTSEERIDWSLAVAIEPDHLRLTAVPEPDRTFAVRPNDEKLTAITTEGDESFRHYLEETEKLTIFHNPELSLYSEPSESREDFLRRCMEAGTRVLEPETDRLESTFRRRIDQMKQKQEREQRVIDDSTERMQHSATEVNIAWGQTLYNITSGRRAHSDAPSSPREGDYFEGISALKKSWDRELEALRDSINDKARRIEEITLTPSRRNIEIRRYVIVWAAGFESGQRRSEEATRKRATRRSEA